MTTFQLKGRVFFKFDILTETGLHIGGSDLGVEIGGVDKTVIRDKLTNRPYIPGSSLKGKMRSLMEKYAGKEKNYPRNMQNFHVCLEESDYIDCNVCQVFGVPGELEYATPTRLVVRDVLLGDKSAEDLEKTGRTDLPYTEVKTEVSIDRVTSAANPRQMERVPAGVIFDSAETIYSIYDGGPCSGARDIERLKTLLTAFQLLEDDYLGGQGTRGAGKVKLMNIRVGLRSGDYIGDPKPIGKPFFEDLSELTSSLAQIQSEIKATLGVS
jgi:CRISPR-associated protein Csm3